MAKFSNVLNTPRQREEHSELDELAQFFRHLWHTIKTTEHSEEHTDQAITEQERYENTLKALFGSNYPAIRAAPKGFTYGDMRKIVLRKNETGNLEGSIEEFLKAQQEPIETTNIHEKDDLEYERDTKFSKDFEKIKQHLYQAKHLYEGKEFEEGWGFPWS